MFLWLVCSTQFHSRRWGSSLLGQHKRNFVGVHVWRGHLEPTPPLERPPRGGRGGQAGGKNNSQGWGVGGVVSPKFFGGWNHYTFSVKSPCKKSRTLWQPQFRTLLQFWFVRKHNSCPNLTFDISGKSYNIKSSSNSIVKISIVWPLWWIS